MAQMRRMIGNAVVSTMRAGVMILLSLIPVLSRAQTVPAFTLRAERGPHPTGFKVIEQYDYSRTFRPLLDELGRADQGVRARPLQTLIWYPANAQSGKPMTFEDYVNTDRTDTNFGRPRPAILSEDFLRAIRPSSKSPMLAQQNATAATGKFPVVIYAPSFSSAAWENADLCEYLASFGYVVISSPGMGVHRESTHDLAGTDAQARDISFLIGFARTLPDADTSQVGVMGFSWGGLSAVLAAARDNRIKALVALDGSLRYWPGILQQSGEITPSTMTVPMIFFKSQFSLEDQATLNDRIKNISPAVPIAQNDVLTAWIHGDLMSVQMLGMVHPQFNAATQRNENFWEDEFSQLQEADYGREDGIIGYAWVARYTEKFLDAYLKHEDDALKYLKSKPAENGAPAHLLAATFRAAQPIPPTFDTFKSAVGEKGFDHAAELYAQLKQQHRDFVLDPNSLDSWGNDLIAAGHFVESLQIRKLSIQLDASSHTYYQLGEVYKILGQRSQALAAYRHALSLEPSNVIVKRAVADMSSK